MSINRITLVGNLTRDPETKIFDGGGKIVSFSVATSERGYTTKEGKEIPEKTEFHNIICNNWLTEVAEKYLRKGDKVHISGKLRYRTYEDNGGVTRTIAQIQLEELETLSSRN